jgi:hypothetical protein
LSILIHREGFTLPSGAKTGAVRLIQRFGPALNVNPHLHMLFPDGAYACEGHRATFRRARQPQPCALLKLLWTPSAAASSGCSSGAAC